MNRIFLLLLFFQQITGSAFAQSNPNWRDKLSPEILAAFEHGEKTDILIAFTEKADLSEARQLKTKSEKAHFVAQRLLETAGKTQTRAIRLLRDADAQVNSFYLVNAMAVENADPALLPALAQLSEVGSISLDPWVTFQGPAMETAPVVERNAVEWGVDKISAPLVWALGYTGQGITVGGSDTGYQWDHPALKDHYRGWNAGTANHNYNWHDAIHEVSPLSDSTLVNFCGLNAQIPCDDSQHGTHTMGTMTGDDGLGNQIGVAPGAKWIGCRNMERGNGKPSTYIECFEFFLAPTDLNGQNPDPEQAPHVINNSWYCAVSEGCTDLAVNELMRQAVINLRTSGVVVVVSNGNFGNSGCNTTYGPPAYFEESFSVGATRFDDTLANFSSRGPVTIDGSKRIKPNVAAPGVFVRSSTPINSYDFFSGTSMAGPHVAGLVALILSARPDLAGNVELIEQIVEQTAIFKSDPDNCGDIDGSLRPNNAFGWGRVDALEALNLILQQASGTSEPDAAVVSVLPNPTSGKVIFDLQHVNGPISLRIFNADGRLVYETARTVQQNDLLPVSLEHEHAGVYFWQVKTDKGMLSGKIAKQ
ncbi:MAG TPA: S8 family peptidase [Saprospiraceae bacterium]|nr:S8 family peptidase [Saprospiraceae bacterium]HPI06012.1 S8 family peptidase [Saprospiraceae bacterium]